MTTIKSVQFKIYNKLLLLLILCSYTNVNNINAGLVGCGDLLWLRRLCQYQHLSKYNHAMMFNTTIPYIPIPYNTIYLGLLLDLASCCQNWLHSENVDGLGRQASCQHLRVWKPISPTFFRLIFQTLFKYWMFLQCTMCTCDGRILL